MSLRLRRGLFALALAAIATLAGASSASAAPYYYNGAESGGVAGASAFTQFYAASSATLISIQSNHVNCPALNGAHASWCGTVNNNTGHAQAGVNYTVNGVSYWMRMDIYAAASSGTGHLLCTTRGNAPSHFVTACNGVSQ